MTTWCQCNKTDDRKVIEKLKIHGPIRNEKDLKSFRTTFYKECRSGCNRPCVANVTACILRHSAAMEESLCDAS